MKKDRRERRGKNLKRRIYHFIEKRSIRNLVFWMVIPLMMMVLISYLLFYYLSARQLYRQNCESASNMVNQIAQNIDHSLTRIYDLASGQISESYFFSLRQNIKKDTTPIISPTSYRLLYKEISGYVSSNPEELLGVELYVDDGSILAYCTGVYRSTYDIDFTYEEYGNIANENTLSWVNPEKSHPFKFKDAEARALGLMLLLGDDQSPLHGFAFFELKDEVLTKEIDRVLLTPGSIFSITRGGELLFEQKNTFSGEEKQHIKRQIKDGKEKIQFATDSHYFIYQPIIMDNGMKNCGLGVMAAIPSSEMTLNMQILKNILFVLIIFFLLLCTIMHQFIYYSVSRPVILLEKQLSQVSGDSLALAESNRGSREVQDIRKEIQRLLERIRNLVKTLNQEMDSRRIAELNVLHAQINPHFLYNTLDSIGQFCAMGDTEEAQKMIHELSVFYRIGVSKGGVQIHLKEEFIHTRMYLDILQTRFDDFDYEMELAPELEKCLVIKTILQPIVENAVYHGIRPTRMRGMLRVWAEKKENAIYLYVKDDGVGIESDQLQDIRESFKEAYIHTSGRTYGLRNVHARIRLTYGEEYGICIESEADRGCTVLLKIPFINEAEQVQKEEETYDENIICR